MTTVAPAPRRRKPPAPVNPDALLLFYNRATGRGAILIARTESTPDRLGDHGRTVGLRLTRPAEGQPDAKVIDVDFTDPHGWRCDCEDATYRPDRPGGCKHLVSVRRVAALLAAN